MLMWAGAPIANLLMLAGFGAFSVAFERSEHLARAKQLAELEQRLASFALSAKHCRSAALTDNVVPTQRPHILADGGNRAGVLDSLHLELEDSAAWVALAESLDPGDFTVSGDSAGLLEKGAPAGRVGTLARACRPRGGRADQPSDENLSIAINRAGDTLERLKQKAATLSVTTCTGPDGTDRVTAHTWGAITAEPVTKWPPTAANWPHPAPNTDGTSLVTAPTLKGLTPNGGPITGNMTPTSLEFQSVAQATMRGDLYTWQSSLAIQRLLHPSWASRDRYADASTRLGVMRARVGPLNIYYRAVQADQLAYVSRDDWPLWCGQVRDALWRACGNKKLAKVILKTFTGKITLQQRRYLRKIDYNGELPHLERRCIARVFVLDGPHTSYAGFSAAPAADALDPQFGKLAEAFGYEPPSQPFYRVIDLDSESPTVVYWFPPSRFHPSWMCYLPGQVMEMNRATGETVTYSRIETAHVMRAYEVLFMARPRHNLSTCRYAYVGRRKYIRTVLGAVAVGRPDPNPSHKVTTAALTW